MANELYSSVFTCKDFRMDLTISGEVISDFGFESITIPGISEAETEDIKLNNATRRIITSPGVNENFQVVSVFQTDDWNKWRAAAKAQAPYVASISGVANSPFSGKTIVISGQVLSCDSTEVGIGNHSTMTLGGQTDYYAYSSQE